MLWMLLLSCLVGILLGVVVTYFVRSCPVAPSVTPKPVPKPLWTHPFRAIDIQRMLLPHMRILELDPIKEPLCNRSYFPHADSFFTTPFADRKVGGSFSEVPDVSLFSNLPHKYDMILVPAHSLHAQPCLLGFLEALEDHLITGGKTWIQCRDRRYSYDYFCQPTRLPQVLVRTQGLEAVEAKFYHTHDDPLRHWAGDHGEVHVGSRRAESPHPASPWVLEPRTLAHLLEELHLLGKLPTLALEDVSDTPENEQLFCVVLKKFVHSSANKK